MSGTTSTTAGRRRLVTGIIAAVLVGGATIPAHAAVVEDSPRAGVQPAAAPPEVFEAFDDARSMTGTTHATFAFGVPAGRYAITAKLSANTNPGRIDVLVECELSAGGNFDRTIVLIDTPSDAESMAMSVAHDFPVAGSIVLDCRHRGGESNAVTTLTFVKITATRVNALTHIRLG